MRYYLSTVNAVGDREPYFIHFYVYNQNLVPDAALLLAFYCDRHS